MLARDQHNEAHSNNNEMNGKFEPFVIFDGMTNTQKHTYTFTCIANMYDCRMCSAYMVAATS